MQRASFSRLYPISDRIAVKYGTGVFIGASVAVTSLILVSAALPVKIAVGLLGIAAVWALLHYGDNMRYSIVRILALLCIGAALSGISGAVFDLCFYRPVRALDNSRAEIRAVVLEPGTPYYDSTRLRILVTDVDGVSVRDFYSYTYLDGIQEVEPGTTLSSWCRLYVPDDTDTFDREHYYRSHRVYLLTELTGEPELIRGETQSPYVRLRYILPARLSMLVRSRLLAVTDAETAPVLNALILGDTSGLDASYVNAMRRTGLAHITAVSGMNVALIAGFFLFILRRRWGSAAAVPAIVLFTLMVNAEASVTRAAIMEIVLLISSLLEESPKRLNTLFSTFTLMIAANPYAIQDAGLQLSFAATLGMMLYAGGLEYRLMRPFRELPRPVKRLLKFPAGLIASTLCAELFTLPILILVFGSVSSAAPLANLLVAWAAELAFGLGVFAILVPAAFPGKFIGSLAALAVRYQLIAIPWLDRLPSFIFHAADPYALCGLIAFYLFLAIFIFCRTPRIRRRTVLAASLLLALTVTLGSLDSQSRLYVNVFNTKGGACTVFVRGNFSAVINCGGLGDSSADYLADYLSKHQLRKIDFLFVTDGNSSECSGISALANQVEIRNTMLPSGNFNAFTDLSGLGHIWYAPDTASIESNALRFRMLVSDDAGFDANRYAVFAETDSLSIFYPGSIDPEELAVMLSENGIAYADVTAASPYYSRHELPIPTGVCIIPSYMGADWSLTRSLLACGSTVVDLQESGDFELAARMKK